jgi:hypothetical protein
VRDDSKGRRKKDPMTATINTVSDLDKLQAMKRYAPRVWLAQNEEYFPCSVEWAFPFIERFQNTDDGGRYWLQTKQGLSSPSDDSLPLFKGDLSTAPVYAFWVPKTGDFLTLSISPTTAIIAGSRYSIQCGAIT